MMTMNDEKTKQKAIEAAADIYGTTEQSHSSRASCYAIFSYDYAFTKLIASCVTGVDSITADLKEQKLIVIGDMDAVAIAKKLKKIGKIEIVSVGPAKAETKEEKKDDMKEEKKDDKK